MQRLKKAFTLVELIVVITILAILWTIAYISLQWYSTSARDSTRISDLSSMKTSLELFHLDAWKYPIPTDWVDITYSGWVVWTQWIFWETVYVNVDKLDKVPTDPVTDSKYTYSITSSKNEYELSWIMEWDEISYNAQPFRENDWGILFKEVSAWEIEALAYTTWNYNGQMTKSNTWNTCNILAIPTIITNDTSVTDLQQIITNNSFVYRWYKNLPSSFKTSKFKFDWWFTFAPNNLIAYTDTNECTALTYKNSYTARVQLLSWLQNAYSGTILENVWEIKNISSLVIDVNNPSLDIVKYAWNFVNNNLWWKIIMDWNIPLTWPIIKLTTNLNWNGTIAVNNLVLWNSYTLSQTDIAYLAKSIMANNTCNASGSVISYLTGQWYTYSNWNIQYITPASNVTWVCNFNWSTNTITQCMTAWWPWGIVGSLWAWNAAWPSWSYYHMVNNWWWNSWYWIPAWWVYLWVLPQWSTQNLTPAQIYTAISTWLTTADLNYFLTDCHTGNPYTFISAYNSDWSIYVSHPTYWTWIISKDNIWTVTKNVFSSWTCLWATSVINVLTTNSYSTSAWEITNLPSSTWWDCWVNPDNVSLSQCIEQLKVYYSTQNVVARQEVGTAYVLANPWLYNLWPTVNSSFSSWVGYSNPWINPDWGALSNLEIHSVISNWLKTADLNYFLNNCNTWNIYSSISSLLH